MNPKPEFMWIEGRLVNLSAVECFVFHDVGMRVVMRGPNSQSIEVSLPEAERYRRLLERTFPTGLEPSGAPIKSL